MAAWPVGDGYGGNIVLTLTIHTDDLPPNGRWKDGVIGSSQESDSARACATATICEAMCFTLAVM